MSFSYQIVLAIGLAVGAPALSFGAVLYLARRIHNGRPGRSMLIRRTLWNLPAGIGAVAGTFAAAGVAMAGYVLNDYLGRIKDEEARVRHIAEIASSFQAEISAIRIQAQGTCATFARLLAETHQAGRNAPFHFPEQRVWQAYAPQIGLLDGEAGPAISWFYGLTGSVEEAMNAQDLPVYRKYNQLGHLVEGADQVLRLLRETSGKTYEGRVLGATGREPCSVSADELRPKR